MTDKTANVESANAELAGGGAGTIAIIFFSIVALFGLFLFSRAVSGGFQLFGGLLALFAVLMLFRVIALLIPSQH
jgi:hypothetical protein